MAGADPKPPTRFTYHASWTVTDPADGLGLEPIAPPILARVFHTLMEQLVEDVGQPNPDNQAAVGAVSVTCQQEPDPEVSPG